MTPVLSKSWWESIDLPSAAPLSTVKDLNPYTSYVYFHSGLCHFRAVMQVTWNTLQSSKRFSHAAEPEISLIRISLNLNGCVKTTFNLNIPLKYLTFACCVVAWLNHYPFTFHWLFNWKIENTREVKPNWQCYKKSFMWLGKLKYFCNQIFLTFWRFYFLFAAFNFSIKWVKIIFNCPVIKAAEKSTSASMADI